MKPVVNIAVRSLVAFVLRGGDLRSDYFSALSALEGIRAHQKIQRSRPEDYQAEAVVGWTIEAPDLHLCVNGRIDGVYSRSGRTVIEEIKSTQRPLKELAAAQDPLHWGQAQCYGYLWACQEDLDQIDIQLTYVDPRKGKHIEILRSFDREELRVFFEDLLDRYLLWLRQVLAWRKVRDSSLAQLCFPFGTYRRGQRDMAVAVYRSIRDGGQLLAQAATGIGKTMAVLFPALKALGGQRATQVLFLTARTTGRLAAEAALSCLRGSGARVKGVTLTAKEKICFNPGHACLPEECAYSKGFYDRINTALSAAFESEALTRSQIEAVAREHAVCPFELSLELVDWIDCVIGDYNYVFDPTAALKRLHGEHAAGHALLVDEAHNLVDRAREMFSASIARQSLVCLRRAIKNDLPGLHRQLGRVQAWMTAARRRCLESSGDIVEAQAPAELIERLQAFLWAAERWLMKNIRTPFREALVSFYFEALRFLQVAEQVDRRYAVILTAQEQDFNIKFFCIDPSQHLGQVWSRCGAAVLFSATLTPAEYFQAVLGCRADAARLNITSPFPPSNLAVLAQTAISTYYNQREDSCKAVSRVLRGLVRARAGHYLAFFPSYQYLKLVRQQFEEDWPDVEILAQAPDMDESRRDAFLEQFNAPDDHTLLGFAVMGGIFGEGIDLQGDRLTGAAIVGVGLPGIGTQRELIRNYYEHRMGCGFEYAYQYPGINRVLQAAGRVIRSEHDRGVVLLIDQRYAQARYRSLLPDHWEKRCVKSEAALEQALSFFWQFLDKTKSPALSPETMLVAQRLSGE